MSAVANLILVVRDDSPRLSFRGCTWKGVSKLRNGPSSVGPGVMDLVGWRYRVLRRLR